MIGAIGNKDLDDIVLFEVSDKTLVTFNNFVRTNTVRYSKQNVHLKKPVKEFIGPELDTITLDIILKAEFGINPRVAMDKLIYLQRDGETISLVIGEGGFGMYRWTISTLSMVWENIDSKGNLISATCSITLEEYI